MQVKYNSRKQTHGELENKLSMESILRIRRGCRIAIRIEIGQLKDRQMEYRYSVMRGYRIDSRQVISTSLCLFCIYLSYLLYVSYNYLPCISHLSYSYVVSVFDLTLVYPLTLQWLLSIFHLSSSYVVYLPSIVLIPFSHPVQHTSFYCVSFSSTVFVFLCFSLAYITYFLPVYL